MADYSKGKIYKLTCESGAVYIGSTILALNNRLSVHKDKTNSCSSKHFINPKIEVIELYPCKTKSELLWKEREWMDKTECVNICRPIITDKEKKTEGRERSKQYSLTHADEISEYHKSYHLEHKVELNKISRLYRLEHRDELNKKKRQKINCECGGKYTLSHKSRHSKSKKHIEYLETL